MTRLYHSRLVPILVAIALAMAAGPQAHGQTWAGGSTSDWNTASHWSPATVPNSLTAVVNFTNTGAGAVNISSSVSIQSLTFSNGTGAYNLTSNPAQTLSTEGIFVTGLTGVATINLANVANGSLLLYNSGGSPAITNASSVAGSVLTIGSNTVIGDDTNFYPIMVGGPQNIQISASFAPIAGAQVTAGMAKTGTGTVTLSGNGGNLLGGLSLAGGTLVLDYSTVVFSKFGSGALTLGGGVLSLTVNTSTAVAQTVTGNTIITGGHTDVGANGNGTITLNAGAMPRTGFGTVDFALTSNASQTFNVLTTEVTTNGLLGIGPAYATVMGGQSWATASGGAVAFYNGYGTNTYTTNTNVDVTASSSQTNFTANSLRFSAFGTTLTLAGTNTLQSGGILVTPGSEGTITGGTLTAPGGGELLVHGYNVIPAFAINSALVSTVGLTKTGGGTLTLGGNNTGLTGPINVNRGSLTITTTAAVNSASQINFADYRAGTALQTFTVDLGNNTNGTIIPPISVSAFSTSGAGTVFSTGASLNSRITLNSGLTSAGGQATPIQFTGDASDTSGFNIPIGLLGGSITLSHGYLGLQGQAAYGNPLILGVGDAVAGGLVFLGTTVNEGGAITFNSTTRIISNGSDSSTISGTVTSTGSGAGFQIVKAGTGALLFSGNGAGQLGGLTINGGEVELYYASNAAVKFGGGILTLNGGSLVLFANSTTAVTQTIPGGTVVNSGHTDITAFNTGTITLATGAITRSAGGTVDFTLNAGPTFTVTTTTGVTAGLLGTGPAFATVNGGSTWATVTTGAVVGLATFGTNSYASGTNTDVTSTTVPAGFTTNSLRFNTGNLSLTLSATNSLQSGGILVTPLASGGAIAGGTLTAPSSGELLIHQYGAGNFTINSALVSTAGLTKTGSGMLILGGNNTGLTGPINVNRGGITATTVAAVNSASQINFNDAESGSFRQQFTVDLGNNATGTISPPIRLSVFDTNVYGTQFSTGVSMGSTVTLSGVISSAPGLTTSIGFTSANATSTSQFNLTNANTFTGDVNLVQGFLGITADASLGNAANNLNLNVDGPTNGGLVFLNSGITVARRVSELGAHFVSNGTDSNTISGAIIGTDIVKDGTGTLTISNPQNTISGVATVNAGILSLGATGVLGSGTNVTVAAGATFSAATAANGNFGVLTLNGGAFRVPAGTGQQYTVNQIVTGSAGGTVDFTGAGSDQLVIAGSLSPAINIAGNSTWLSPGNGTTIVNAAGIPIPITIQPGVTLTNGLALATAGTFGYLVSGGGTLFQNSDTTNVVNMAAPVTVLQSTFRVTDASSNGGVGNLGTGAFTLSGGTFDYGGATATTVKAIAVTTNGATIQIESAAATLTANGAITGPGGLTKTGSGTLVLGSMSNSFTSLTIAAGGVQAASDAVLGTGPVTVNAFGTLTYTGTTTTTRTFNLNSGRLGVAAGQTLTLNGGAIGGGFLAGPGTLAATGGANLVGLTTLNSAIINQTGVASFVDVTNGGALTIAAGLASPASFNGFTNQGSGAITIGANSQVNVADFESYGLLTLTPANVGGKTLLTNTGTPPLYFNGGSRTFIGTVGGNAALSGIELNGQNAIVAGGLFVNNGQVTDNSAAGVSTIIADYGALVKGAGQYDNSPQTQNGGRFQAGNSPGVATVGRFVFGPGGVSNYVFAIDDATGQAGPTPDALGHVSGWGLVKAAQWQRAAGPTSGDFVWTADALHPLTVAIDTLVNPTTVGIDVPGLMADFDPTRSYSWPAVEWTGAYSGPTDVASLDAATIFDTSGFANPVNGTFGWSLSVAQVLNLSYTPSAVPEPGTLALVGFAAAFGYGRFRRGGGRSIGTQF